MYRVSCVRHGSENLKQLKTKWWISKWRRWQERFQGRSLSDGPSPVRHVIAHLFCRLPALALASNHFNFQHPQTTIAKLPQNSYVRMQKERRTRMNVGTSSSKPAPDQMAAEMRRCCQLQASSSMHRSYPWHLFVVVFTVLSWICCFGNINWLGLVGGRCKTI